MTRGHLLKIGAISDGPFCQGPSEGSNFYARFYNRFDIYFFSTTLLLSALSWKGCASPESVAGNSHLSSGRLLKNVFTSLPDHVSGNSHSTWGRRSENIRTILWVCWHVPTPGKNLPFACQVSGHLPRPIYCLALHVVSPAQLGIGLPMSGYAYSFVLFVFVLCVCVSLCFYFPLPLQGRLPMFARNTKREPTNP